MYELKIHRQKTNAAEHVPGQLGRTLLSREALNNAESKEKLKLTSYLHELIRQ